MQVRGLKRPVAAVAALAATGLVVVCTSSAKTIHAAKTGTSASAVDAAATPSLKGKQITYVAVNDSTYNAIGCGIKQRVQQLGGSFNQQDSQEFSASSQAPVISAAIASHPDGLIVSPADPVSLYAPLKAASASIPVATVLNNLKNRAPVTTEVTYDNLAAGRDAAKFIAQKAHGRTVKVAAFSFTPGASEAADAELAGFQQQLKKYHNINYVGAQYAGAQDTIGVTTQKLDAVLSANPNLFAVWTHAGDTGSGALAALRQRHSKALLVANYSNTVPAMVNGLKNGSVAAIFGFSYHESGVLATNQLADKLNGQSAQRTIKLQPTEYTRSSFSNPAKAADLKPPSC